MVTTQTQIEEVVADNKFLIASATTEGFYKLYFNSLPKHLNQFECFNALNDKYFDLIGEYRYSSYVSFINTSNRYRKRKK